MKKITLCLLTFLFIFNNAQSQFNFSDFQNIGTTSPNPFNIAIGDVNNDGYDDILVATRVKTTAPTSPGGDLELFINDLADSGTFIKITITNSLQDSFLPAIADINGDGFNDIIAGGAANATLAWYPNDGTGGFPTENIISSSVSGPTTVVVGDIDNNNTIDVATAAYGESSAVWFSNTDGNGSFSEMKIIGTVTDAGPIDMDLGDFDGDGDLDAVVAYLVTGTVEVYDNNFIPGGTVSFTKYDNTVSTGSQALYNVVFGDVNDDENLDIVLSDYGNSVSTSTGDVLYFTRDSELMNTTFTRTALVESAPERPWGILVNDFTGDDFNDVVYVEAVSGSIFGFESTDSGSLLARSLIEDLPNVVFAIASGDFDGDNVLDIAAANNNGQTLTIIINNTVLGVEDYRISGVKIYPNPVKSLLKISGIPLENRGFKILNYLGQIVMDNTFNEHGEIDLSPLNMGMYFLKIDNAAGTFKIIKQ